MGVSGFATSKEIEGKSRIFLGGVAAAVARSSTPHSTPRSSTIGSTRSACSRKRASASTLESSG